MERAGSEQPAAPTTQRTCVRDSAGNESIVTTQEPVNFARPRAVLKGITPVMP